MPPLDVKHHASVAIELPNPQHAPNSSPASIGFNSDF
jgi:hypothetical protein